MKTLIAILVAFAALSVPAGALAGDQARIEQTLQAVDVEQIVKILRAHFSPEDIDRLADYFKDSIAGKPAVLPDDLQRRFRQAMGEIRLEYGFQIAVLLAELKKSTNGLLDEEQIDELAKQLELAP